MKVFAVIGIVLYTSFVWSQEIPVLVFGNQVWMAENANREVGNYASVVVDSSIMVSQFVYDWESALKACPDGFSLPNDADWDTLIAFCDGFKTAGTLLKKTGNGYFGAVLTGNYLPSAGFFNYVGDYGYYWSADEFNRNSVWVRVFGAHQSNVTRTTIPKQFFLSVRCIKK